MCGAKPTIRIPATATATHHEHDIGRWDVVAPLLGMLPSLPECVIAHVRLLAYAHRTANYVFRCQLRGSFFVAVYWPCAGPLGPSGELRGCDNHCGHHQAAPAQGHAHRDKHSQEGGASCLTHPPSGALRAPGGTPVVGVPTVRSITLAERDSLSVGTVPCNIALPLSIPYRGAMGMYRVPDLEGFLSVPPTNLCVPLFLYLQERLKALAAMAEAKRSSATSAQTIAARQAAAEAAAKWKHGDSARVLFLSFELPAGERASPVRVVSTPALCYAIQ